MGTQDEENSGFGPDRPGNDLPPGQGVRQPEPSGLFGEAHAKDRRKPGRLPRRGRAFETSKESPNPNHDQLARGDGEIQQRTVLQLTEDEFLKLAKNKGLDDWDIDVALGALKKGVTLDLGDKVRYAIRD